MTSHDLQCITPDWPAPASVKAVVTTRSGGVSQAPYDGLNLATHVGDEADAVAQNRALLLEALQLPSEPVWLNQTHSDTVVELPLSSPEANQADVSFTAQLGVVCAVLTADCLPILVCNKQGTWVQVIHAGWQGLAKRVVEASIQAYPGEKTDLMAWFGPAIGPEAFEVQVDVVEACTADLTSAQKKIFIKKCFKPIEGKEGYFLGNLYELGRQRLHKTGVQAVYGGNFCTFTEAGRFFSYRREAQTGRMASLIWLAP